MPCYHPLKAYSVNGVLGKNGRPLIHFFGSNEISDYDFEKGATVPGVNYLYIPCGNCIGCRLEYSRQWATRCVLEAMQYKDNYFLTLTYDNDHLPTNKYGCGTLIKKDLQKFMKDLRRYYEFHYNFSNIRFFACGEYGSSEKTHRPHFHIILFNCPIYDICLSGRITKSGFPELHSDIIKKIWKKGLISIAPVNFDTCAYTSRYMLKKHKGLDSNYYEINDLGAEFTLMSRMPGIGAQYLIDNYQDIYTYDNITLVDGKGNPLQCKPPKYYDKLFDIDNDTIPNEFLNEDELISLETVKSARALKQSNSNDAFKHKITITKNEYLSNLEFIKKNAIKKLVRPIE